MSITKIVVTTPDSAAMVLDQLNPQSGASTLDSVSNIVRYFGGLADGAFYFSSIVENVGEIQATGLLTMTGAATAAQTLTIANITFTAETSGATGNQYNLSSTVAIQAANIAAAVNGSTNLKGLVTATSALGVVTLTSVWGGAIGNTIELAAGNTSNMTATAFSGGSDGTHVTLV